MTKCIIKIQDEEKYIYKKMNGSCIAYRDTKEEAKQFKTLKEAQKYIQNFIISNFEIIEVNA